MTPFLSEKPLRLYSQNALSETNLLVRPTVPALESLTPALLGISLLTSIEPKLAFLLTLDVYKN